MADAEPVELETAPPAETGPEEAPEPETAPENTCEPGEEPPAEDAGQPFEDVAPPRRGPVWFAELTAPGTRWEAMAAERPENPAEPAWGDVRDKSDAIDRAEKKSAEQDAANLSAWHAAAERNTFRPLDDWLAGLPKLMLDAPAGAAA